MTVAFRAKERKMKLVREALRMETRNNQSLKWHWHCAIWQSSSTIRYTSRFFSSILRLQKPLFASELAENSSHNSSCRQTIRTIRRILLSEILMRKYDNVYKRNCCTSEAKLFTDSRKIPRLLLHLLEGVTKDSVSKRSWLRIISYDSFVPRRR